MDFGIVFANAGRSAEPEHAVALAQAAEAAGFESLRTVENVVVPAGYESTYPYAADGRMPGGEEVPIPDPLIWLSYVAAATSTIKLATGILILPQRQPLVLAKEVATLDRLSGGRVMLGVGVGWLAEEFEALGVPFAERGARTDEYVEVLRRAWTGRASYDGRFTAFGDLHSLPTPHDGRSVPIHVGGHSDAAARRAGRLGDGFFPGRGGLDELERLIGVLRGAAEEAGRDPDAIEITAGGAIDPDGIARYAALGVARMVVPAFGRTLDARLEFLDTFGRDVIAKVAA